MTFWSSFVGQFLKVSLLLVYSWDFGQLTFRGGVFGESDWTGQDRGPGPDVLRPELNLLGPYTG